MNDLVKYLLENSRDMTKEESEAYEIALAKQSTVVRKLYDLDDERVHEGNGPKANVTTE
jgi:uncharacterized protein HemX